MRCTCLIGAMALRVAACAVEHRDYIEHDSDAALHDVNPRDVASELSVEGPPTLDSSADRWIDSECAETLDCGQTLDSSGSDVERETSHDAVTEDADGTGCSFGDKQCDELRAMACDGTGHWIQVATCKDRCVGGVCQDDCVLPWGGSIPSGQSAQAYQAPSVTSPDTCEAHSESRLCVNGVLTGSYLYQACTVRFRDCMVEGWGALAHGASLATYAQPTVACGESCTSVTLVCVDGSLVGGTTYHASCSILPCTCKFQHALGYSTLSPGQSCSSDLVNVTTTSNCTGGAAWHSRYACTYTCASNGQIVRSAGGPCEIGNGPCGGSVSSGLSATTCP